MPTCAICEEPLSGRLDTFGWPEDLCWECYAHPAADESGKAAFEEAKEALECAEEDLRDIRASIEEMEGKADDAEDEVRRLERIVAIGPQRAKKIAYRCPLTNALPFEAAPMGVAA